MKNENRPNLDLLLEKYTEGTISDEEKQELYKIISIKENENIVKEFILSEINDYEPETNHGDNFDSKRALQRILSDLNLAQSTEGDRLKIKGGSDRIKRIVIRTLSVAAALAGAFLAGAFYASRTRGDVQLPEKEITYNEVKAPFGSNSEINLPDGSRVRLNAGSTIKYSTDFNQDNRDLFLNGEAYFKVAKNLDLPLNVNAGMINVKATGTEFNIKAYDDEATIETTLVEGSVEITRAAEEKSDKVVVNLNPNQKAIFIKDSDNFSLNDMEKEDQAEPEPQRTLDNDILISPKVDVGQVSAWTKGRLDIRGEKLKSLCQKLERKYDVSFVFMDDEIKSYSFSGILLDETLEQVLNALKLSTPTIYYNLTGKTVYLNLDRSQLNDYSRHLK